MSININLVDKRSPEDSRKEKAKKLRGFSFVILIATGLLAVVIFAFDFRFSAAYVKKQQADLLKELEPFSDTSAKVFILNSKLSNASDILSKRKKYQVTTGKINENISDSIEVDKYSIDDTGISISISSTSLQSIDEFMNNTLGLIKTKDISGVVMKSLSVVNGRYVVELTII